MHLSVQNISFAYGTTTIMKNLSLEVTDGQFVSIIAPSGSGKSTLFYLIGGLLQPQSGQILLESQSIVGKRGQVSYMPQSPSLLPWRTVQQNVQIAYEIRKKKPALSEIHQLLERAGLAEVAHHYPHQLSGGMQQRVAFIRTLAEDKPILCLDEPFGALDALTRTKMQNWLQLILKEEKRTVLFITHSIEEAILLSDRIYVCHASPLQVSHVFHVSIPMNERQKKHQATGWRELTQKIEEALI
ncbi:ABC transporter ATP-binding protein [Hazenella sp. IB182357]|uniref:ABC transporter ATP-binding protein n=1 Tax=Polycladospora coralii TaxID=2771432 RepID=A0A926NCA9_9BACL|nr:ABC transporter ATP-binding protein [Polycladospora coralii]MBD1370788.1 ABC transporter ATP-binding protein [Polycladospora coralii]MBS7529727.1 ABC transporter ATP-binding protein [Polycladospora coralii]